MAKKRFILFDWAMKTILRNKENFGILEGLVRVLLDEPIHIEEILESESNPTSPSDKFNRVDIKARDSRGDIIIVEVQLTRQIYYMERILYGVAKTITEHINLGETYEKVKKVYSISVVYFDLGTGKDFLYRGQTEFHGITEHDILDVSPKENSVIRTRPIKDIFPEYFIIRLKTFNKIPTNYLEEWIRYMKDGEIDENTQAPGLKEAKEKLEYLMMSKAERLAYDDHVDAIMVQNDALGNSYQEGLQEGMQQGMEKGKAEGLQQGIEKGKAEGLQEGERNKSLAMARKMKAKGYSIEEIADMTDLSLEEVQKL